MATPTKQMQRVLDVYGSFNAPPLETLSPSNARKMPTLKNAVEEMAAESLGARATQLLKPMPEPVGKVSHIVMPSSEGDLLARVYTPKGDGPFPVLVYFHGGGWVIANLDVYEPSCRALCNAAGCIVVSVAYRQAPEHKYPAAVNDAYAATQWVLTNARQLNGDPTRVAVGGESAGANLATVTCLKTIREGGQKPLMQLLIYPVTDARMAYPSYEEHREAVPLHAAMMPWFWQHYLENEVDGQQPYASPVLADEDDLNELPPATIITAEIDPLRDEGEAYAQRLKEVGVAVEAKRYEGVTHEFFGLAGVVDTAQEALAYAATHLKRAFERQSTTDAASQA
ncbi:acetyl esterase [Catalinimonas alkaloidigena]|uniref:Acetyl esterase n=1 Tax=Catalinimonas alkaloidigena TaxID=1075417 RepID=A0A1G9DJQ2_9BACT|nr:alpha/beta hydrolase [Catalinimonas alkaloidigena]SDK64050.1 acetyl esterase [Catalinimonas alkaloidigena]